MSYQEEREQRIAIFENTMRICEREPHLLRAIEDAREQMVVYWKADYESLVDAVKRRYEQACKMEVLTDQMLEEIKRQYNFFSENKLGVLNVASPFHPGGMILWGGNTLEERLCRCSTLYPCLNTEMLNNLYYEKNRRNNGAEAMKTYVYIPQIICFREENESAVLIEEKNWFSINVINCTTPDLLINMLNVEEGESVTGIRGLDQGLEHRLENWMKGIFSVAVNQKIDVLIVDVSECKIFRKLPFMLMDIFKRIFREYRYSFKKIYFAINQ